ncbi:TPA: multidrug effflux MFS transporter [Legionella pneumophila]|uniref:Bcr/CflA family efflux transporter n=1 Tax=Legionella pneumophila TaxID=446 RepID=A0A2S6EXF4_LEGPN|nr:multidrug effflux MFS transporter [Legionella pneumophila]APF04087.1 Bcr/CflA family drug resistance efflux transporter [Legionella pneumophila subsp. fraseri]AUB69526.1 Bcr/CflA family drug resistance efflux transporter [Legionella pneumophila]AUB72499.1 Bcr/CflA family drug resistance efflux transporter [Legionella pneumophila]KXB25506.1 MFS transporter [Legionella pneumophila]KXB27748.1 MFS transporter [Legionella pneumophila]
MNSIGWTERQSLYRLFPLIISISFAMDVFVPAIPEMSRFFKTDSTTMQATLYLFMLTVALGQLLVGPLADRFGRRKMALSMALLFLAGSLISALAPSVPTLIFARIIQAAGACGTYLLCFIIVRDNFSTNTCARLFSILSGTNSMVASSAPVIGGLLLDLTQDWHSGFYFLTLLGVLMSGIAFRYIPDYHYPKPELPQMRVHQVMRQIIDNSDFRQYTLIAAASLLGLYLFCALSPGILITQLHLSATEYGFWFGLNAMTVFIANMMAARLTYSHSLERIVRWGLVLMILSCFFMIALNLHQSSILSFMLPMLCLTVGIGMSMGTATALALKDFEQQAGIATALLGACQFGLAGLIGILTAQWMPEPLSLAIPVLCFTALGLARITKFSFRILSDF